MTPSATAPRAIAGLGEIAGAYDGFILDLWGCVHDGLRPFPGAVDAMLRLRADGRRVAVLSNAPRRSSAVEATLKRLGIGSGAYDAVLSSGEVAWQALARRDDPWHARLGRRCLLVGPERDFGMIEGNGLERSADPNDADFVLVTGPNDDSFGIAEHVRLLEASLARSLPMVCANPDLEVIRGTERLICAGAIAGWYEARGGDVRHHGKPFAATYDAVLELLGVDDRARILAVGDGLRTDIAGAVRSGIASAFIPGGVHGAELGARMGELPSADAVAALASGLGALPNYLLPSLRW